MKSRITNQKAMRAWVVRSGPVSRVIYAETKGAAERAFRDLMRATVPSDAPVTATR